MFRSAARIILTVALALLVSGCDWYGQNEIALRALPYPYDAGVAVDSDDEPCCLAERGIRFVYAGEEVRTAGQDAACSLIDRGRQSWESFAFLYDNREWRAGSFFANRLFEPRTLDGGATAYAYKRYAGSLSRLPGQMPPDVAAQVAEGVAYELKAKGGVMIMNGPAGRAGAFSSVVAHMRREHEEGRVYNVERDRLLVYCFVRRYLDWEAVRSDDGVTIRVHAVDDGLAKRWIPSLAELEGITFYTPDPERTRVLLAEQLLDGVTVNPPDRTRRGSVTIGSATTQPTPIDTSI